MLLPEFSGKSLSHTHTNLYKTTERRKIIKERRKGKHTKGKITNRWRKGEKVVNGEKERRK